MYNRGISSSYSLTFRHKHIYKLYLFPWQLFGILYLIFLGGFQSLSLSGLLELYFCLLDSYSVIESLLLDINTLKLSYFLVIVYCNHAENANLSHTKASSLG